MDRYFYPLQSNSWVMHEALQYTMTGNETVKCSVCNHRCTIQPGKTGICGIRRNESGTLYATTYGRISAEAVDPIEKKPLYHFLPGSLSYSLGGIGCNFHCEHCQNWHISQVRDETRGLSDLSPAEGVSRAVRSGCRSISWTYNEPAIWHEYPLDMGTLARGHGLGTIYVTNGYITEEALDEVSTMLLAYRVDLKAFNDDFYRKVCGARLQPVLDSTVRAKEHGMHIETVTLVIPGLNDNPAELDALMKWVLDELGPDTPMHFTRFHPDYRMTDRTATPLPLLEKIYSRAKELGIRYPYLGNVARHPFESTYCPSCGGLLIERAGFAMQMRNLEKDHCTLCGEKIAVVTDVAGKA